MLVMWMFFLAQCGGDTWPPPLVLGTKKTDKDGLTVCGGGGLCEVECALAEPVGDDFAVLFFQLHTNSFSALINSSSKCCP